MKTVLLEMERLRNLRSGLGQFCFNLGRALLNLSSPDFKFTFYVPASCNGLFGNDEQYIVHSPAHKFLPPSRRQFDCWHCPHQDSRYLPAGGQAKLLLTIHDLNFMSKYAGQAGLDGLRRKFKYEALQRRIDRSTALAFSSRFTREAVNDHFCIDGKMTRIIPLGNCLVRDGSKEPSVTPPPGRVIFTVGIISPKKNFHVLVPLLRKLREYVLVIAGDDSNEYAGKIRDDARYYGVSDRVLLIGPIVEEEKVWWYRHCEAFVFPSLAEGFGLPVVEAMSLGKPVFLSTFTSLPEVGGTEAFYWESFDPDAMTAVFESGIEEYRRDIGKATRIMQWAENFSWENTARRYLDFYAAITE
jgi:glycosyltransferase involved in cell wall biosynthesis